MSCCRPSRPAQPLPRMPRQGPGSSWTSSSLPTSAALPSVLPSSWLTGTGLLSTAGLIYVGRVGPVACPAIRFTHDNSLWCRDSTIHSLKQQVSTLRKDALDVRHLKAQLAAEASRADKLGHQVPTCTVSCHNAMAQDSMHSAITAAAGRCSRLWHGLLLRPRTRTWIQCTSRVPSLASHVAGRLCPQRAG